MINKKNRITQGIIIIIFLLVTFIISRHNYLLFHAFAEGLSIFISFSVFVIAWNSKKYMNDDYLLIIGIAYLFIGVLDFLHTLSYKGMSIFLDYDYYANQLWIAARFFESIIIVTALFFVGRKKKIYAYKLMIIYSFVFFGIIYSIFYSDIFPVCFIEGKGQTLFKLLSEYLIIFILFLALILIHFKKHMFEKKIAKLLALSIFMTMSSEMAFTFYVDNYGIFNLIGHYFKIVSFYLIYEAIIVTGIRNPYNLIFKELSDTNKEMQQLNEKLLASIAESEEANQAKSKYTSVLSHEMRTPLNGILGFAQLMQFTKLSEEQAEYTDEIIYSANNLRQIIDNVLDVEKFKTNKMQFSQDKIMLKKFLLKHMKFFEMLCKDKGLRFEYKIDIDDQIHVLADGDKIKQVLNNLISNAVKFTEEGSVHLNISCVRNSNDLCLMIQVRDTGTGITQTDQELLFEPFVQVGEIKKTKYGGSGLGLSICQEIVNYYKGNIEVESVLNNGSSFTVTLHFREL